jgi:hypothetical protein
VSGDEDFLSRWSRRKTAARDPDRAVPEAPAPKAAPAAESPPTAASERAPLPPVEALTPESDFSPFMDRDVDSGVRSQALKALFTDPHFNTVDMLDVYMDDYSIPDPLPESWLGKLRQMSRLGDRAGRDREEAERRNAAAAGQTVEGGPDMAALPEDPPPANDGGGGGIQDPDDAIPALPIRDSST